MSDSIVRAITRDNNFRAIAVDGTEIIRKIVDFRQITSTGIEILGQSLLSSVLVANILLKGDERLLVTIEGDGKVGKIVTEASANGLVRGYITNPKVELNDIGSAIGTKGYLHVVKEMDGGIKTSTGLVELVSDRIDDNFTYYMLTSEQISSLVKVDIIVDGKNYVKSAGGFIVSTLPNVKQKDINAFYQAVEMMPDISEIIQKKQGAFGVLKQIFGNDNFKKIATSEVGLYPALTKKRYASVLATLQNSQLKEIIKDDQGAEIIDKFTGNKFYFTTEELQTILCQKYS